MSPYIHHLKDGGFGPKAITQTGVEALLVDQASPERGTVADFLSIPFITICSAVVLNREDSVPPFVTNWGYNPAWWALLRNRVGYQLLSRIGKPIREVIAKYRREWKLPPHSSPNEGYSQLAQISQQPAELEFPRQQLPQWFHFTGPYHSAIGRETLAFPFALSLQAAIQRAGGVSRAADIIEQVVTTGKPVLANTNP